MTLAPQPDQSEAYWFTQWTQEEFQEAEDAALRHFPEVTDDDRFKDTCRLVSGYRVVIRPERVWINLDGLKVSGETPCAIKTMYVNATIWWASSFVHEMAHAVQNCEPRKPWSVLDRTSSEFYHQHWDEDGINRAIERANE
jgi:hypothetical protein